ncbi:hypothetical protein GFY24_39900 [Nocardia sp. SYP-A9097]|uniref:hypothetical protein n=1 Tax=Nocardia sp. SYP-A9097 TaxID=2663237 RepID=UPI00129A6BB0|nr:hypothetical protein [Nocardia sp. SYP-A9097]MRH93500.1 hypothetical protein [Nocardia sp. SYP-A9097]
MAPVPYPEPHKLPVVMCQIPNCPYRRRNKRGGYEHVCQQHERMWDKYRDFDRPLDKSSVELKYTLHGYPAGD